MTRKLQRIWHNLTIKHVHIKPLGTGLFSEQDVIVTATVWGSFVDDLKRYGVRVAVGNFWYMVKS
jgi:hypothetical protein